MNIPGEVCNQGRSEKKRSRAQEKQPLEKSLHQLLAMPPTRHKKYGGRGTRGRRTRSRGKAGEGQMSRELVQVVRSERAQELCQVRKIVVDDVTLEMRELTGVLVHRERCAETKAEIVARRLDRMEKERDEEDEAECEANL